MRSLRKQDATLWEVAHAGREILVIPEIVKSCLFSCLGEFVRHKGDYLSTTVNYFYSIFHSAVAIYKAHFDYNIVPEREFNPNLITVKRKGIHDFVIRLNSEGLISEDYKRTYVSLQKRRDHVNYQPRVILGGKHKNIITFFACQYGDLVSELEKTRPQLSHAILETAELIGHVLCYYYENYQAKDLLATLMFRNWSNICIKTYEHWGSSVEPKLEVGTKICWNASLDYEIGDKSRKSIVPLTVIRRTEKEIEKVLKLMRARFLSPRIQLQKS